MINKLSRILDKTENYFTLLAGFILIFITFCIILEVFYRQVFNQSFTWVHEVSEYTLLYIPFLTAAWLMRTDNHIVVDLLENILSERVKFILDTIILLLGITVSLILTWYGFKTTLDYFVKGLRSHTELRFPQAIVVGIIPIGSLLLCLECLRKMFQLFFSNKTT